MEYAKQGPYISKVIYYQPIDAAETSEQSTSDVDAPPPRSSPKSRNRYFIKYFRIAGIQHGLIIHSI
ncbi:hypothetical protein ECG_00080 [Echinococcus granulosus]|uniref:Expressed protein n=1 Tax=Echinococcus granulosus TaxID=6210 RepID=A0A068WWJ2_ECHGR|nr:hypothetical protein ECG_00080 [Echinococcus granulosus]CDS22809.1 expressed protein [Echinococcus granulosus]